MADEKQSIDGDNGDEFEIVLEKSGGSSDVQSPPGNFDRLASIPKIFCCNKDIARGLFIDITAMVGSMNAIQMDLLKDDPKTKETVLKNMQTILSNLGDLIVRDCGLTEDDLNEITKMFQDIERKESEQKTQG